MGNKKGAELLASYAFFTSKVVLVLWSNSSNVRANN